jgi:hypothetical protein
MNREVPNLGWRQPIIYNVRRSNSHGPEAARDRDPVVSGGASRRRAVNAAGWSLAARSTDVDDSDKE